MGRQAQFIRNRLLNPARALAIQGMGHGGGIYVEFLGNLRQRPTSLAQRRFNVFDMHGIVWFYQDMDDANNKYIACQAL